MFLEGWLSFFRFIESLIFVCSLDPGLDESINGAAAEDRGKTKEGDRERKIIIARLIYSPLKSRSQAPPN